MAGGYDRHISYASADKATGLLLVQNWPTQIWFPFWMDILISEPFIIPPSINQFNSQATWRRLTHYGRDQS